MKTKMPMIFAGHGSPMNAIENNEYTKNWERIGKELPKPKKILSISAHWATNGSKIGDQEDPKQIYDMYGFPQQLYDLKYHVSGDNKLAEKVISLSDNIISADDSWGIDHGSWAVLCKIYPEANIPVVQLSVDMGATMQEHFELGRKLKQLREEGVLIFASGDIVHNLRMVDWSNDSGYAWADSFDNYIIDRVLGKDFKSVINYTDRGEEAIYSVPTVEHFVPLLYVLGAVDAEDDIQVFNDSRSLGSISMTGFVIK